MTEIDGDTKSHSQLLATVDEGCRLAEEIYPFGIGAECWALVRYKSQDCGVFLASVSYVITHGLGHGYCSDVR